MFLIGRKVTGNQLKDLKLQKPNEIGINTFE